MINPKRIPVAIAGIGNCYQALLRVIAYYRQNASDTRRLMNVGIVGYKTANTVRIAAFEIHSRK